MTDSRSKAQRAQPTSNYYRHVNLFIGNTPVPPDGHFGIDKARVHIHVGREEADGWHQRSTDETDERWLIIEEPEFWPVMVRLSAEDIECLRTAVNDGLLEPATDLKGNEA